MDKIDVNVEMTFTLDKTVYTAPNFEWWVSPQNQNPQTVKNFETFFDYHVIGPIANDYAIIKREADRTPANKEQYKGTLKVLENIIPDIRKSIKYTVLSDKDGIENVQANFNFGYYEQERTPEYLFDLWVMVAGVNRYKSNLKMIPVLLDRAKEYGKDVNLEEIGNKVKQWEYVVSFFEGMKCVVSPEQTVEVKPPKKLKK